MSARENPRENPRENEALEQIEKQIDELKRRAAELRRAAPATSVKSYTFRDAFGRPVQLHELFGDKSDLLVVHNMGVGCTYCTLWADGFIGLDKHLNDRCAFVVSSPDDHEIMAKFAAARHWPFRMISIKGTTFAADMGFGPGDGRVWPGISSFQRQDDNTVLRIAHSPIWGPGDDYNPLWHMLDLLREGPAGWEPKFNYPN